MYYKKFFNIVLFSFLSLNIFASQNPVDDFKIANTLYQEGKFQESISKYNSLIERGFSSENAYFNLANSYAKVDSLGKSILYYEKVLKLNPKNKDAKSNLGFVKSLLKNDLNELPELFFVRWYKNVVYAFDANTWAWITVALAWFSAIAFIFYFFIKSVFLKKTSFFKGIFFIVLALLSLVITNINNGNIGAKTEIILTKTKSISKTAPSANAENSDVFFEGSKFKVLDSIEGFYKIKTLEGNVLWLNQADFEEI